MMKTHPAELARIAKDERARLLLQHEMIVLCRSESGGLDPQPSAHSEMNPQPVIARELKEHLFPARKRAEELLPDEPALE